MGIWFFFFIENMDGEAQCVIYYHVISNKGLFCLRRHYYSCHENYDNLSGGDWSLKLFQLRAEFFLKFIFDETNIHHHTSFQLIWENAALPLKKASYVVALALAKQCRQFEDGIFFTIPSDVLNCFSGKCQEGSQLWQNIPLSRRTVARSTEEISKLIYSAAKTRLINCKYFSLSIDESTDINNICQLIICIKTVDENLTCFDEVLELVSLHGNVTGQVLYDVIESYVFSIVDKSKLSSICTDGAQMMRGKNRGLLGILKKHNEHCCQNY